MKKRIILLTLLLLLPLYLTNALAEQEKQVFVKHGAAKEGEPLNITIETPVNYNISKATLHFKNPYSSEFRVIEARPQGNKFVATIPGKDVVSPSVEYYVRATYTDKSEIIYPAVSPQENPVSVTVKPQEQSGDIIVISPAAGEKVLEDDLLISVSYYTISENVDLKSAVLTIDGKRINSGVIVSENMMTYLPDKPLTPGAHRFSFEISDKKGNKLGKVSSSFVSKSASQVSAFESEPVRYTVQSWAELRNETISDSSVFYSRLNVSGDLRYKSVALRGYMYVTNEEDDDRQASNRFFIRATTPVLDASFGDIFPEYNYYIANGLRIRGYELNAHLGPFRVDMIQGITEREVTPKFGPDTVVTDANIVADLESQGFVKIKDNTYAEILNSGTFQRDVLTVRAGVNSEVFQLDFQFLKGEDDFNNDPLIARQFGVEPSENIALGSSFKLSLLPRRFDLFADVALSMTNTDITNGSIDPDSLDALLDQDISQDIEDNFPGGYDRLTDIITINENLLPLYPLDLSSLAYRFGTNVNFLNNFLRVEYLNQGQNFKSYGLAYYQPDVKGFRIFDRLRLLNNRLFLSANFERLTDNLLQERDITIKSSPIAARETLSGTTTRTFFKGSVSVFPGLNWPNLRLDYSTQSNKNDFPTTYIDSTGKTTPGLPTDYQRISGLPTQVDNSTNSFTFDASQTFDLSGQKLLTVGFTTTVSSRTDDRNLTPNDVWTASDSSLVPQDLTSRSITINGSLTFPNNLRVNAGLSNIQSEYYVLSPIIAEEENKDAQVEQNFYSMDLGVGYPFLNNKLRPSARMAFTFGDFKRTVLGFAATYDITPFMFLTSDLNFLFVGEVPESGIEGTTDVIASIKYQLTFGN